MHKKLEDIGDVDGFILKGRSPSCGIKDIKVYSRRGKAPNIGKDIGVSANHEKNQLRYEQDYLLDQSILSAFSEQLLDISDSDK